MQAVASRVIRIGASWKLMWAFHGLPCSILRIGVSSGASRLTGMPFLRYLAVSYRTWWSLVLNSPAR